MAWIMDMRTKAFNALIYLWVLVAFIGVGYNLVKSYSEVKSWYFLTDSEKKYKIFGDEYRFLNFLKQNTSENSKILFLSGNDKDFFLSRYFLYPRKIDMIWQNSQVSINDKDNFSYIISNTKRTDLANFTNIATYSAQNNFDIWLVYRKK